MRIAFWDVVGLYVVPSFSGAAAAYACQAGDLGAMIVIAPVVMGCLYASAWLARKVRLNARAGNPP